ncbi:MAG: SUMF1/EgtB/PvdO family nonheme iron enzyme [Planctomycetes bacterium]|nr:SUMF1/EgtB/PvdO family nonheme iron enzyme [Planctomycetota bacterium]
MSLPQDLLLATVAFQAEVIDEPLFEECCRYVAERAGVDLAGHLKDRAPEEARLLDAARELALQLERTRGGAAEALAHLAGQHRPAGRLLRKFGILPGGRGEDLREGLRTGRNYRLLELLGEGSRSRVFLATDEEMGGREVALKLLRPGHESDEPRFLEEAEILSRLQHPAIVPVYDVGRFADGSAYYAMKPVDGRTLADEVADAHALFEELTDRERAIQRMKLLGAYRDLANAVAAAHARAVIHRNLKPSNVLLGDFGETVLVGWRLARRTGESARGRVGGSDESQADESLGRMIEELRRKTAQETLTGSGVVGTPHYMAPEQAGGDLSRVDERADVYSLGAVLYEILSGQAPYRGGNAFEVLERLEREAPQDVAALPGVENVPQPLVEIVRKAMARDPEARYQSAKALGYDLFLFMEGAKERERRGQRAQEKVAFGDRHRRKWGSLRALTEQARDEVKLRELLMLPHQPVDLKRSCWEARENLAVLEGDALEEMATAVVAYNEALAALPDHLPAREGLCQLHLARFLDAQQRGDQSEMALARAYLLSHDTGGYAAQLEARGSLLIQTVSHPGPALVPAPAGSVSVEFDTQNLITWAGSWYAPGGDPARLHLAPRMLITGPTRGGYEDTEERVALAARVRLYRYVMRDLRYVTELVEELGETPVGPVDLPIGRYVALIEHPDFVPVSLPLLIERDALWRQEVVLYRARDVPAGFVYVPGGPYIHGGGGATAGGPVVRRDTGDLFVSALPVTCGQYLEYLNQIARDHADEARRRAPRDGGRLLWPCERGRWRLPAHTDAPLPPMAPEFPVVGVSWDDALAFCAWCSRRDGVVYRLPSEEEYEKAARGVDGRRYTYGEEYEGTYAHTSVSFEGGPRMGPVGLMAADASPYGLRDLSGGAATWCFDAPPAPNSTARIQKGGAWCHDPARAEVASRRLVPPEQASLGCGIRLVRIARAP